MEKLLGLTDIAELTGDSPQNVQGKYRRGKYPDPDYELRGRPAWRRRTLANHGIGADESDPKRLETKPRHPVPDDQSCSHPRTKLSPRPGGRAYCRACDQVIPVATA